MAVEIALDHFATEQSVDFRVGQKGNKGVGERRPFLQHDQGVLLPRLDRQVLEGDESWGKKKSSNLGMMARGH